MALNALKSVSFEIAPQRAVLFFPLAVQMCIIDGLPPSSLALLLQSSCALLSRSRCRDQRGAGAAHLQAVRSCFFSCILPSTNRDYLILAYKLRRTCRESFFFFFFLLYPVIQLVTCFLFNIFLVGWIRSAELCLAELTAGIRVFYHCPPPPCLSNRFMQSYVSRLRTSDNWPYKAY